MYLYIYVKFDLWIRITQVSVIYIRGCTRL